MSLVTPRRRDVAADLNVVLVGALVIALTILIPEMTRMRGHHEAGPEVQPGWTYNPTAPRRS